MRHLSAVCLAQSPSDKARRFLEGCSATQAGEAGLPAHTRLVFEHNEGAVQLVVRRGDGEVRSLSLGAANAVALSRLLDTCSPEQKDSGDFTQVVQSLLFNHNESVAKAERIASLESAIKDAQEKQRLAKEVEDAAAKELRDLGKPRESLAGSGLLLAPDVALAKTSAGQAVRSLAKPCDAAADLLDVTAAPSDNKRGRYAPGLLKALHGILLHHKNDVEMLCTAACVARAWRVAARQPSLWHEPMLNGYQKYELDRERLSFILATGGVQVLDLSDTSGPFKLITALDVADALAGAPQLLQLRIAGLRRGEAPVDPVTRLAACVRDAQTGLDVVGSCAAVISGTPCGRLCSQKQLRCEPCGLYACEPCACSYGGGRRLYDVPDEERGKKGQPLLLVQGCNHLCVGCWTSDEDFYDCDRDDHGGQCQDDADASDCSAREESDDGQPRPLNQFCWNCLQYCDVNCESRYCFACSDRAGFGCECGRWCCFNHAGRCKVCDRVVCEVDHCFENGICCEDEDAKEERERKEEQLAQRRERDRKRRAEEFAAGVGGACRCTGCGERCRRDAGLCARCRKKEERARKQRAKDEAGPGGGGAGAAPEAVGDCAGAHGPDGPDS